MKGLRATPGRAVGRARVAESIHHLPFRCSPMMRATFFAIGLFVALWGGAFIVIDKVELASDGAPVQAGFRGLFRRTAAPARKRVVDPPDWAAFSLMSVGAVTMLYAVALPKKQA